MLLAKMERFLMNETDRKVVNELLSEGCEWPDAVRLAYVTITGDNDFSKVNENCK